MEENEERKVWRERQEGREGPDLLGFATPTTGTRGTHWEGKTVQAFFIHHSKWEVNLAKLFWAIKTYR